jgi:hypothetical protein
VFKGEGENGLTLWKFSIFYLHSLSLRDSGEIWVLSLLYFVSLFLKKDNL